MFVLEISTTDQPWAPMWGFITKQGAEVDRSWCEQNAGSGPKPLIYRVCRYVPADDKGVSTTDD